MKKSIFFDVDGTIQDEQGYLPESAVAAIRDARARGILCFLNTGRPYTHIEPAVLEIGFDGCICSCGQVIYLDGQPVFRAAVAEDVCRQIFARVEECRLDAFFEAEEWMGVLLSHPANPGMQLYLDRMEQRGFSIQRDFSVLRRPFDKFCIWVHEDSDLPAFAAYAQSRYTMIDRGGGMYECVIRGFSKATGIARLLEMVGLSRENTYAIGDSSNDLPMLRYVAHSIAMGNAPDSLKGEVEIVTEDLSRDGLKKALDVIANR